MLHLTVFTFMSALALGTGVVFHLFRLYRRTGYGYLRWFGLFYIFFNVPAAIRLLLHYSSANLWRAPTQPKFILLFFVFSLEIVIFLLLWAGVYALVSTCAGLEGREVVKTYKRWYWGLGALLFTGLGYTLYVFLGRLDSGPSLAVYSMAYPAYVSMLYAGHPLHSLSRRGIESNEKLKLLKIFGYFYLGLFFLLGVLRVLSFFTRFPSYILLPFFYLGANLATVLWVERRLVRYLEVSPSPTPDESGLEQLFSQHQISKREREIIHLICSGKSNKEIEAELFISLQTVKYHIYNIYKKMGVKSRIQLSNMVASVTRN